MKNSKLILLYVVTIFCFSCRKYPENKLWFKKPEKVFKEGRLTKFTVDDIDSIPRLNSSWGYDLTAESFKLNKLEKSPSYELTGSFRGEIEFANNNKIVEFTPQPKTSNIFPNYNPFSNNSMWEIIKCTNKGVLKLQRAVNGKIYKLQFN